MENTGCVTSYCLEHLYIFFFQLSSMTSLELFYRPLFSVGEKTSSFHGLTQKTEMLGLQSEAYLLILHFSL